MKKTLFLVSIFLLGTTSTFAATEQDQNAADFLATKNIIATASDYKLDSTITRREMLKVMMNLSGKSISDTCTGKFQDLPSSDWGCKYAEAALANGYISANSYFRPNDSLTGIEALKMIMNAKNIPKGEESVGWESTYRTGGANLIWGFNWSYEVFATDWAKLPLVKRNAVFTMSAMTYDSYIEENLLTYTLFENEDFSVDYPSWWTIYEGYNTVSFGPSTQEIYFKIEKTKQNIEDSITNTIQDTYPDMPYTLSDSQYGKILKYNDIALSGNRTWRFYESTKGTYIITSYNPYNISIFENISKKFYSTFHAK